MCNLCGCNSFGAYPIPLGLSGGNIVYNDIFGGVTGPHQPYRSNDGDMGTLFLSGAFDSHWLQFSASTSLRLIGGVAANNNEPSRLGNFSIYAGSDTTFPGSNTLCYKSSSSSVSYESFTCPAPLQGTNYYIARLDIPGSGFMEITEIYFYASSGVSGQVISANGKIVCVGKPVCIVLI